MLELLLLSVLCQTSINGDDEPAPMPTPFRPTVELVELNEAAVQALMPPKGMMPAAVLTVYSPTWCPTCPAWKQRLGTGGDGLTLNWVAENPPAGYPGPVPAIYTASGLYWDWGANYSNTPTVEKLSEWAGVRVMNMAPQTVGAINAKGFIDSAIQATKSFGGDSTKLDLSHSGKGWIDFGQAGIFLPTGCRAELRHSGTTSRLTFSGTKPRVRLLAIDQPIDGVLYDGNAVTVDFSGWMMPDAKFDLR